MEDLMLQVAKADKKDSLRNHQLAVARDPDLLAGFTAMSTSEGLAQKRTILLEWFPGAGKTIGLVTIILYVLKETLVDTFFVTCPNVAPARQTWELLCRMSDELGWPCMKIWFGSAKSETRPILRKLDILGRTSERKLSIRDFHGPDHLKSFCMDATRLVIIDPAGVETDVDRDARYIWHRLVSDGLYVCSNLQGLFELLSLAKQYGAKSVVHTSLAKGDLFMQYSSVLQDKTWTPALATDEFHYGAMSGSCFNNLEIALKPTLYLIASATPPPNLLDVDHHFVKTLQEGIAEGVVPDFKKVYFDIEDLPETLLPLASHLEPLLLPSMEQLSSPTLDCTLENFEQARSIFMVHCVLLLALTMKEFARQEELDLQASVSTSFLTFFNRKWHAQLAQFCMETLRGNVEWTLALVRELLWRVQLKDRDCNPIPIVERVTLDLQTDFLAWLQDKLLTMRVFYVASSHQAAEIALSVDNTDILTFIFDCQSLLQGFNAPKLSHVLFLSWQLSDAFIMQAQGRCLRQAAGKTQPWCVFITDQERLHKRQEIEESGAAMENDDRERRKRKRKKQTTRELVEDGLYKVLSVAGEYDETWDIDETEDGEEVEESTQKMLISSETLGNATRLSKTLPWESCYGHQLTVFQGKMIVTGGRAKEGYVKDCWYSSNSTSLQFSWQKIPAHFRECKGHAAVVTENHMLVMGGTCAGGQYSRNAYLIHGHGKAEIVPLPSWGRRHGHQAVCLNNYIIVMGGRCEDNNRHLVFNDIHCSGDNGRSWTGLKVAPWPPRSDHQASVCGNRIVITGGRDLHKQPLADSWCSDDMGASWSQLPTPPFEARGGHQQVLVGDNTMIVCGGLAGKPGSETYCGDAWLTTDAGMNWTRMADPPWSARAFHQIAVFGDSLVMLGGMKRHPTDKTPAAGQICSDAWGARLTWQNSSS